MFKCKYCGKEYENAQKLGGHVTSCKMNPNHKKFLENLDKARKNVYHHTFQMIGGDIKCECEFCHQLYSIYGLKQHMNACKQNPNALPKELRGNKGKTKGYKPWNKGLTKDTDIRLKNQGETFHNHFQEGLIKSTGGFRENCIKNYKYGWYNGMYCDSSWELAYILYCQDHNIKIERNKTYLTYFDKDNIERKFYPDFIIDDNIFVEIKGMQDSAYTYKQQYNPNVKFIFEDEMNSIILKYVKEKYGKDFIDMYEKI